MTDQVPLFCPFCRECYEGEKVCPEHELTLVPLHELAVKKRNPLPADDEEVAFYELRFGRGPLLGAALLVLAGFVMPVVTTTGRDGELTYSGADVATHVGPNLWCLPFVAATLVAIVLRRRTPKAMRGARLALPLLALLAIGSLGYTAWRIVDGSKQMGARMLSEINVSFELGMYVMLAGAVLAIPFGIRFGLVPYPKSLPHGATAPAEDSSIVIDE